MFFKLQVFVKIKKVGAKITGETARLSTSNHCVQKHVMIVNEIDVTHFGLLITTPKFQSYNFDCKSLNQNVQYYLIVNLNYNINFS